MPTFKCPWCTTKSSFKSTITSHMKTCSRRPRKAQPVHTETVSDDTDLLTDLMVVEAVVELISDFSSSSDSRSSSSDSPFSGGGGDSGGGGASSDW